jgi:hypothetical protein
MPSTVFLGSHRSFSEGSSFFVVGEAINGGAAAIYGVTVIATFYDAAGNLVGATQSVAFLPQTVPTQANPFKLQLANAPSTVSSYELTLRWDELSIGSFDRATITREEVRQENGIEITGDIRNDVGTNLQNLVVVATFSDARGAIFDVGPGRASVSNLLPGDMATFSVQTRQAIPYSSYLVQIEGMMFR